MGIVIQLNRWDDNCRSLYVYHSELGPRYEASIMQSISFDDFKPEAPTINWASFGDGEPCRAALFGEILTAAARIAERVAGIEKWERLPIEQIRAWTDLGEKPLIRVNRKTVTVLPAPQE